MFNLEILPMEAALKRFIWSYFKKIRIEDLTLSLIKKYDIIKECYQKAQHYINLASNSLTIFKDCKEKEILKSLTSFSLARNF